MLCNLSVFLVHLDKFMLILSIVVSLVHDHISYAVNLLSCLNICFIIIIIIMSQRKSFLLELLSLTCE